MKDEPEKTQYAGSYGRQSDRYEEYVEFVESHAVSSQKEDDGDQGTKMIYTLKPEDVKNGEILAIKFVLSIQRLTI